MTLLALVQGLRCGRWDVSSVFAVRLVVVLLLVLVVRLIIRIVLDRGKGRIECPICSVCNGALRFSLGLNRIWSERGWFC